VPLPPLSGIEFHLDVRPTPTFSTSHSLFSP
jgi:hypothetical protein